MKCNQCETYKKDLKLIATGFKNFKGLEKEAREIGIDYMEILEICLDKMKLIAKESLKRRINHESISTRN